MRVGVAVVDLFTGMYTCSAILAALYGREKSGQGAHIDMALFDAQLAMLANQASNALVSGEDPPRQGNTHPNIVPYQPFQAADQPLIIAIGNDRQFARLAELCGHPNGRWTNASRTMGRALPPRGNGRAGQRRDCDRPAAEWFGKLEAAGIPAGPINRISQALSDVQAQHRAMVRTIAGTPLVGSPVRLDSQRADSDLPPPALGEHSVEVLKSLGLEALEIERLKADGVVA